MDTPLNSNNYSKKSVFLSPHLPTTVSISCSSCSSTTGFSLRSSSMKKRVMDRVSGAAITISNTHCLTFSADNSPWFWKYTYTYMKKLREGNKFPIYRLTCAIRRCAVKLMKSSLSACSISLLFWSTRLFMASCSSWLWNNTFPTYFKSKTVQKPCLFVKNCTNMKDKMMSHAAVLCLWWIHPNLK